MAINSLLAPSNEIIDGAGLKGIIDSNQTAQNDNNRTFVIFFTKDGKKHESLIKEIHYIDETGSIIRFVADVHVNQQSIIQAKGYYDTQSKTGSIVFL